MVGRMGDAAVTFGSSERCGPHTEASRLLTLRDLNGKRTRDEE